MGVRKKDRFSFPFWSLSFLLGFKLIQVIRFLFFWVFKIFKSAKHGLVRRFSFGLVRISGVIVYADRYTYYFEGTNANNIF